MDKFCSALHASAGVYSCLRLSAAVNLQPLLLRTTDAKNGRAGATICTARRAQGISARVAALLDIPPGAHVGLGGIAPSSSACLATGGSGMKGSGAMKPSSMFYVHEADVVQIHHFLEECSLCGKCLSGDIFMYRGDTPFCSEECRQQQIEVDRAKHRRKKRAAAHALAARKEHRHQQPQPRSAGMDSHPWVDAGFARAPALRV
ncbi:hypothetical protein EJB05_39540, partial [Eragrostis curvula]